MLGSYAQGCLALEGQSCVCVCVRVCVCLFVLFGLLSSLLLNRSPLGLTAPSKMSLAVWLNAPQMATELLIRFGGYVLLKIAGQVMWPKSFVSAVLASDVCYY